METVTRLELHREVVEATLALDDHYREIVLQRFFDGRSIKEIAERQGLPPRTVETRLRRAMKRLRARLEPRHGREALALLVAVGAPSTASASIAAPAITGGLLVATKTKVALIVGAVLGMLLLVWSDLVPLPWSSDGEGQLVAEGKPDRDAPIIPFEEAPEAVNGAAERRADPMPANTDAAIAPSWILRGRLRGVEEHSPWTTPIKVVAWFDTLERVLSYAPRPDSPPVLGPVNIDQLDATFEADLSAWFAGERRPARVEVIADDPAYVAVTQTLIPPGDAARDRDGELRWETTIEVQLAASVRGLVTDESGVPLSGVSVGLLQRGPDLAEAVQTDEEGTYRLRSIESGPGTLLAAVGTAYGGATQRVVGAPHTLKPAATTVQLRLGTERTAPTLILGAGATIEGRIVSEAGTPVSGAVVDAKPTADSSASGLRVWLAPHWLHLDGARTACRHVLAVSDEAGRFRLKGLDHEAHYHLSVPLVGDRPVAPAPARDPIQPPRAGLEYSVGIPVEIVVRGIDGARLLDAQGSATFRSGGSVESWNLSVGGARWEEGKPTTWVRPEVEVDLGVTAPGHLYGSSKITLPRGTPAHLVEIDLQPKDSPSRVVRLQLQDEDGRLVRRAGIQMFYRDGGTDRGSELADGKGWYEVSDPRPGPATLVIRGGGSSFAGEGLYLEDRIEIDVPAEGEVDITRTLHQGGRLRLRATDSVGNVLPAKVRLFDESGAPVEIELCARTESEGILMGISRRDHLDESGLTVVDPALEEGRYDLELTLDGFQDLVVPVEVEAGRTVELLDLVMERR